MIGDGEESWGSGRKKGRKEREEIRGRLTIAKIMPKKAVIPLSTNDQSIGGRRSLRRPGPPAFVLLPPAGPPAALGFPKLASHTPSNHGSSVPTTTPPTPQNSK